jgi:hypothetical protein
MTKKTFNEITNFYWKHRDFYFYFDEDFVPDYPEYGCLPDRLSQKMSSEAVDALQDIWSDVFMGEDIKTKKQFQQAWKAAMRELGETVK